MKTLKSVGDMIGRSAYSIGEDVGLTSDEAAKRLKIYGPNKVPERKESAIISLLKKFIGLTPLL